MPSHINEEAVLNAVPITKDVDGFHPVNIGKLGMKNREPSFEPCTPAGVIELLDRIGAKIEGANAVVLGRSNIVGLPVSLLLLGRNATVTVCHSRTKDIAAVVRQADILVAAIGKAKFVKARVGQARRGRDRCGRQQPAGAESRWHASHQREDRQAPHQAGGRLRFRRGERSGLGHYTRARRRRPDDDRDADEEHPAGGAAVGEVNPTEMTDERCEKERQLI